MSKHIYIFSGLGADERAFQHIDLSRFDAHFIYWLPPLKNETIEDYAIRIAQQIKHADPVLVGLSFGGIMAIEVAKNISVNKIILISSVKTKSELPLLYGIAGNLNLHRLLPAGVLKSSNFFSFWLFGIKNSEDKKLLAAILRDTDAAFLKWAIDKITHWKNTSAHENIFHIHGTADRILPFKKLKADVGIPGGGHFMIVNKAREINDLLAGLISQPFPRTSLAPQKNI